jgi:hypothetical protein
MTSCEKCGEIFPDKDTPYGIDIADYVLCKNCLTAHLDPYLEETLAEKNTPEAHHPTYEEVVEQVRQWYVRHVDELGGWYPWQFDETLRKELWPDWKPPVYHSTAEA